MMYDFTLFFEHCSEKFETFDDFADACENLDKECAVDWDNLDVTFYNFAFGLDYRESFCKKSINSDRNFEDAAAHQIKVQREFRNCMSMFF